MDDGKIGGSPWRLWQEQSQPVEVPSCSYYGYDFVSNSIVVSSMGTIARYNPGNGIPRFNSPSNAPTYSNHQLPIPVYPPLPESTFPGFNRRAGMSLDVLSVMSELGGKEDLPNEACVSRNTLRRKVKDKIDFRRQNQRPQPLGFHHSHSGSGAGGSAYNGGVVYGSGYSEGLACGGIYSGGVAGRGRYSGGVAGGNVAGGGVAGGGVAGGGVAGGGVAGGGVAGGGVVGRGGYSGGVADEEGYTGNWASGGEYSGGMAGEDVASGGMASRGGYSGAGASGGRYSETVAGAGKYGGIANGGESCGGMNENGGFGVGGCVAAIGGGMCEGVADGGVASDVSSRFGNSVPVSGGPNATHSQANIITTKVTVDNDLVLSEDHSLDRNIASSQVSQGRQVQVVPFITHPSVEVIHGELSEWASLTDLDRMNFDEVLACFKEDSSPNKQHCEIYSESDENPDLHSKEKLDENSSSDSNDKDDARNSTVNTTPPPPPDAIPYNTPEATPCTCHKEIVELKTTMDSLLEAMNTNNAFNAKLDKKIDDFTTKLDDFNAKLDRAESQTRALQLKFSAPDKIAPPKTVPKAENNEAGTSESDDIYSDVKKIKICSIEAQSPGKYALALMDQVFTDEEMASKRFTSSSRAKSESLSEHKMKIIKESTDKKFGEGIFAKKKIGKRCNQKCLDKAGRFKRLKKYMSSCT